MNQTVPHTSHEAVLKRLRRASGHLLNVIGMIEADRRCVDVAQQLHAVERAVAAAKKQLIHDHVDHCLGRAAEAPARAPRQVLDEFRSIAKYL